MRTVLWGKVSRSAMLLVVLIVGAIPAVAHHSFAMFDQAKTVTVTGSVSKFEWTNPHVYIHVDVPDAADAKVTKQWTIELGSPSILQQGGWKFSDVRAGDKVTASLNPLKSGENGGLLVQITLKDGRKLGNGPGRGPAAPAPATPSARGAAK